MDVGSMFESLRAFLKEPFKTPMSLPQYAALVGLTILLVVMWNFVLREIERGVSQV
jgi:hypothetical protein